MASRNSPVQGLEELTQFLDALPANLRRNAINSGLRAGAKVFVEEIRLRAPKDTGLMAKAFSYGSPTRREDGAIVVAIRPKGKHSFLAAFHEYGVQPHLIARTGHKEGSAAIRAAKDGSGTIKGGPMKIGSDVVSGIVEHPGIRAHPFIRPALDARTDDAVRAFVAQISNWAQGKLSKGLPFDEAA